ncbi:MAG: hypothetical protein JNM31_01390 [Flavobacteriales bacterium]|nr:hypothetical protein [Flavobacteriales bacterium]
METPAQRLRQLAGRVEQVLRERDMLRAQTGRMEQQLRDERQTAAVLRARVEELERENEVLRSARPSTSGPGNGGTIARIDDLVVEIDRCLALLEA